MKAWKKVAAGVGTALSVVALRDVTQKKQTLRRNFPVVGNGRYAMERLRPMLQQYFIEPDFDGRPFDRLDRSVVYTRAKNTTDTVPFGTRRSIEDVGYETLVNSFAPVEPLEDSPTVTVGGPHCTQPYDLSLLGISAMSYGSLSKNAVLAMNKGAAMGGFAHNTGEGGLTQYHLEYGADLIWELGSGYYGARTSDGRLDREEFAEKAQLPQVKMIAIMLSQGAKPGVGGELPKEKISEEIAQIRGVPRDRDLVSPPAHPEFSNAREMIRFLAELRELSGGKPVGIKFCVGSRRDVLAVVKAMVEEGDGPDFIEVDGAEGGTGAAPVDLLDWVGLPLAEGLMIVDNALRGAGLRDQVVVTGAGKVATGADIVKRIIQGADTTMSARAMMLAVGCIQAKECHTNRCPTGVATSNPYLQRGLDVENKGERVYNYHRNTVKAALGVMATLGVTDPQDLNPTMLRKRVSAHENPTYAELYQWLEPRALLENSAPQDWQEEWEQASADSY